jgi:hypothetical protein
MARMEESGSIEWENAVDLAIGDVLDLSVVGGNINQFQFHTGFGFHGKFVPFFEGEILVCREEEISERAERGRVVSFFIEDQNDRIAGFDIFEREFGEVFNDAFVIRALLGFVAEEFVRSPFDEIAEGAVLGFRGAIQKLNYDFFIGAPVNKPDNFKTAGSTAGFSLSASF